MTYKRFTEEQKEAALDRAAEIGYQEAASEFGMLKEYLRKLVKNRRPHQEKKGRPTYTKEFKAQAVALSIEIGSAAAATKLNVCYSFIIKARSTSNIPFPRKNLKSIYTDEFKEKAVARRMEIGLFETAAELGIGRKTLKRWTQTRVKKLSHEKYPPALQREAIALREMHIEVSEISQRLGVNADVISHWTSGVHKKIGVTPPSDFLTQLREYTKSNGRKHAAKQFNLDADLVFRWTKKIKLDRKAGKGRRDFDTTLNWVKETYPQLELWRLLAISWIASQKASLSTKLTALAKFFEDYLIGLSQPMDPDSWLSFNSTPPDFNSSVCSIGGYGLTVNNYIHDFIDWVLQEKINAAKGSEKNSVISSLRNPIPYISRTHLASHSESVYSPLPYAYIDELQMMLASGPDFKDWTWARSAMHREASVTGDPAVDWFTVSEDQIDLNDPDCVWRRRSRHAGTVLEMWSPVRWVALLMKLILPLRTYQVRMLDSGEADTWRYALSGKQGIPSTWKLNDHAFAEGSARTPVQRGALRKIHEVPTRSKHSAMSGPTPNVALYINTNKTADSAKSGARKGFVMPWVTSTALHADPFYWLSKLANWQRKYNPLQQVTSWSDLDARHTGRKSETQLAGYPSACFLFRMPERDLGERHFPMTEGLIETPWIELLSSFEKRLAERGDVHMDNTPIQLVRTGAYRILPEFPLHSLRVSLITALALDGNIPFPILQKLVGHSRLIMTIYYTKIGIVRTQEALSDAFKSVENNKEKSLVGFLREKSFDLLLERAISNDSVSMKKAIPESPTLRNAAGWMPMHIGLCPVGGNINPVEGAIQQGGCYNGGPDIGTPGKPRFGVVPGGARNCVRCRWFITSQDYLAALVAHFNTIMYHFDEARNSWVKIEQELSTLKKKRLEAENSAGQSSDLKLLQEMERRRETAMQKFNDRAEDGAACVKLVYRCRDALHAAEKNAEGKSILIAAGAPTNINIVIEETDSELLQISGVCASVELYPDLDPGKAVFRRSQLLDAALLREGMPPVFMTLDEADQLKMGNNFIRQIARINNPEDIAFGTRKIIEIIDSKKNLKSHLGIDLSSSLEMI